MAVDPLQKDGPVGERRVEVVPRRKAGRGPVVLVPSASLQPGALRKVGGERFQGVHDGLLRRGAHEVGLQEAPGESHEVRVGIDESRHYRPVACVHAPGVWVGSQHVGVGADHEEPPVAHGKGLRSRVVDVDGVDVCVVKHVVGHVLRTRGARATGEEEKGKKEEKSGQGTGGVNVLRC